MNYLKLHSGCLVVDGYLNSIIVDLNRGKFSVVPKSLSSVVKKFETQSIESTQKDIEANSLIHFNAYVDYLLHEEFAFITKEPEYYQYFLNTNIEIFEYNFICEDYHYILNYPNLLDNLPITAIYFRIDEEFEIFILSKVMEILIINQNLRYVYLCAEFSKKIQEIDLKEIVYKYPILGAIYFYSSPKSGIVIYDELTIEYNSNKYLGFKNCGLISSKYFSCNSKMYSESLQHNSCLNRKISIDSDGNIKNCPSMRESYGNIRDTTLAEAIEKPGFKKYWDINKDQIAVCKDCEFRYICTDCRAYVEEPEDVSGPNGTNLSKPLKCGYNPYTGEWSEWSTNPLKQKAIDFYGMREMVEGMKD